MARLGMYGPFELNNWTVEKVIETAVPGNYALGFYDGEKFEAKFIGRADKDLRQVLLEHCTDCDYAYFKASYSANARETYFKQCRNYHEHPGIDNREHPVKPEGSRLVCPVCGK